MTRSYRALIALVLLCPALTLTAVPTAVHAAAGCTRSSFSSDGPPRAIPDTGEVESTLTVPTRGRIDDVEVAVDIEHPFDSDLLVELVSNDGRTVTLAENVGMWGDDFAGTVFDDEAGTSIISSLPPFAGAFRPDEKLSALDDGQRLGTWTLRVADQRAGYAGTLTSWTLFVTTCSRDASSAHRLPAPPSACGPVGADPLPRLPDRVPTGHEAVTGTLITVDNDGDLVNGDITSAASLLADPGADGISLREAITATNNDPGTYTIRFSDELDGATIEIGATYQIELPALAGGGVLIDGDIDGDGLPDVTIANGAARAFDFIVASSDNRIHALTVRGFNIASVLFDHPGTDAEYRNNTVTGLWADSQIVEQSGPTNGAPSPTNNAWLDTRIIGNTLTSENGVSFNLHSTIGDRVERLTINNNRFDFPAPDDALENNAVNPEPGRGIGSTGNSITDAVIAYNWVAPSAARDEGIRLGVGGDGAEGNTIEDVRVSSNDVGMRPGGFLGKSGISVYLAESHTTYDPGGFETRPSRNNAARRIAITDNSIHGQELFGIRLITTNGAGSENRIEDVTVSGNHIRGTVPPESLSASGIFISGGWGFQDVDAAANVISGIDVLRNTITLDASASTQAHLPEGGIAVVAGGSTSRANTITGVALVGNRIRTELLGISLVGGWALPDESAARNRVDHVQVRCNVVVRAPTVMAMDVPGIKGVNLTGGSGSIRDPREFSATRNTVSCVHIRGNLVAGKLDAVSIFDNLGHGARLNSAGLRGCGA